MKRWIVILLVLWAGSAAWGDTITYTWLGSPANSNCDNPANWLQGEAPTIKGNGDYIIANTPGSITVREGMTGMGPATNTLNNSGVITLAQQDPGNPNQPNLIVTSILNNSGQINVTAGTFQVRNNAGVIGYMAAVGDVGAGYCQTAGVGLDQGCGPYPVLRDVFYVQAATDPNTRQTASVLIRRGKEWHGPDFMLLNTNQILLVEPVNPGSRVATLIAEAQ